MASQSALPKPSSGMADTMDENGLAETFTLHDYAMLRMEINTLLPDRPTLGASFSDADLKILLRAGFKSADHFRMTTEEALEKLHLRLARIWSLRPVMRPRREQRHLQELLRDPLPAAEMIDFSDSDYYKGAHDTHPTTVEEWPDADREIRRYIEDHNKDWDKEGYEAIGEGGVSGISNSMETTCALLATVLSRLNHIFKRRKEPYRFTTHPSQPTASQTEEWEPEEVLKYGPPDIYLLNITRISQLEVLQTTMCETSFKIEDEEHWSMPALWTAYSSGKKVYDEDVAQHVTEILARALGHMSRRGHRICIISIYTHTWLLRTNMKGLVQMTPAIRHDQQGTDTKVSMTELFLYSTLCNLGDQDMVPYPTGKTPGQKPRSPSEFQAARERARREVSLSLRKRKAESEGSS